VVVSPPGRPTSAQATRATAMPLAALPALLALALSSIALAQQQTALGGPCGGTTGLYCVSGGQPGVRAECVDGRGRMQFQLYGDGPGAAEGPLRCAKLVNEGEACGAERNVLCAPIFAENRPAFPKGPTVPGVCEAGVCVRGKVGLRGDWCRQGLGLRCLGDGDAAVCDEDRLFCEWVGGYPEDAYHCVTKQIAVGAACNTGQSRTVPSKVFERCVEGATCASVPGEVSIERGLCKKV
jgi:hypothetical protein